MVCDRSPDDRTAIDILLSQGKTEVVESIEKLIFKWINEPDLFQGWREILIIRGYDRLLEIAKSKDLHPGNEKFLKDALSCQVRFRKNKTIGKPKFKI